MAKELDYEGKLYEIKGILEKEKEIFISTANGNKVANKNSIFCFL